MTHQKEGINSEKGTRKKSSGEPHRREVRVTPGEEAQVLRNVSRAQKVTRPEGSRLTHRQAW